MKNISEFDSNRHGERKSKALVVHHAVDVDLVKVNRILFCLVILLLAIIVVVGSSLVSINQMRTPEANRRIVAEMAETGLNPVLSKEINGIKTQMVGLVSGSIESKLRILELTIQSGKVSDIDLALIADLRNDVNVLRQFSKIKQAPLFASKQETLREMRDVERLMGEFTQLKMLIYITIASCGLMLAAVGGVWLQQRYLLGYEKKALAGSRVSSNENK